MSKLVTFLFAMLVCSPSLLAKESFCSTTVRHISILGVPIDLGGAREGSDHGPDALRAQNLKGRLAKYGHKITDVGNVFVKPRERLDIGHPQAKYLEEINRVNQEVAEVTEAMVATGKTPLVLGGDHSLAMGSISGVAAGYRAKGKKIGLIYVDKHADINTGPEDTPDKIPSTETGNVHGMPLAYIFNLWNPPGLERTANGPIVDPNNFVYVGLSDVDAAEHEIMVQMWQKGMKIEAFSLTDIRQVGIELAMQRAIQKATDGTAGFHLSFDPDWMRPTLFPGVGTPGKDGGSYIDSIRIMDAVNASGKMLSMDFVELNPPQDKTGKSDEMAVRLIEQAFRLPPRN